LPGSLATVTSSPIIRASFRQIARPSPVPPSAESELALRFRQGLGLDQQTLSFVAAPALAEAHDHGTSGAFRLDPAREQRISGGQKLEIVETDELLDRHPVVQRSVRLRNPYVDPMNAIQVELLARYRAAADDAERELLRPPLLRSVTGIAAALRNTG